MTDDRTGQQAPGGGEPRRGRRPGRRPHPGPDASEWALQIWHTNERVADLLEQFPEGEERQQAASLLYRDADGAVRTRHQLLRAVPDRSAPAAAAEGVGALDSPR